MGLLPFEFLPFRRLRGVQTVIQNRVPVKTGDSGAFSAATAGPPLNLGRGPGVAYYLSGPLSVRQVRTSFKHYRTDTCPTDDYAGPSHAATSSPADALFSHVAVREKQGMRPAGFGLLFAKKQVDISSTTRTATTCCSSNTSTLPRKLSKVEIHASPACC